MSTVKEMHIGIDVGLQKLNTEVLDSILPETKDWVLTQEMLQFINTRMTPKTNVKQEGFQETTKRYDDLEELITEITLPVYKKGSDARFQFSILPFDYFHHIEDESNLSWDCRDISAQLTEGIVNKYISIMPFNDGSSNLYADFQVDLNTGSGIDVLLDIANFPSLASGLNSDAERFVIIDLVLQEINQIDGIEVRYENYNGRYYKDTFIFITDNPNYINVVMKTDTNDLVTFNPIEFVAYTHNLSKTKEEPNRLTKAEDLKRLMKYSFGSTKADSPLSAISRGFLEVARNESFILNSIRLKYIRRPRKISLSLNQSCELHRNVHDELVDKTVERLSAFVDSNNINNIVKENLTFE